ALAEGQRRMLEAEFGPEPSSFDDLLHRASDVVARFTRHAAAVLARRVRRTRVRRIELFPMGVGMAMLVLVADNGRVERRLLQLDALLTDADLETLARKLDGSPQGATVEDGTTAV